MIDEYRAKKYCKDDISKIENYQEAISDEHEVWDIHHRRETDEGISGKELIRRKEYFWRHADELIFLKRIDHNKLHRLGSHHCEKTKKKMSEAQSGEKSYFFGKHWWNNGTENVFAENCPPGFRPGRLCRHRTEKQR